MVVTGGLQFTDHVLQLLPMRQCWHAVLRRLRYFQCRDADPPGAARGCSRAQRSDACTRDLRAASAMRPGAVAFVHHFDDSFSSLLRIHCDWGGRLTVASRACRRPYRHRDVGQRGTNGRQPEFSATARNSWSWPLWKAFHNGQGRPRDAAMGNFSKRSSRIE